MVDRTKLEVLQDLLAFPFAMFTPPIMETNKRGRKKMDELKVRLSTKFMRTIVAKLLAKFIYNKYGYKVDIQLNELDISVVDGDTKISTNVEVKLESKEFVKIVKSVGLD
jgi:hypothetical protein